MGREQLLAAINSMKRLLGQSLELVRYRRLRRGAALNGMSILVIRGRPRFLPAGEMFNFSYLRPFPNPLKSRNLKFIFH